VCPSTLDSRVPMSRSKKPPKLKDLDGWFKWEDLLISYLLESCSKNLCCPRTYLLCQEKTQNAAALGKTYNLIDDDLIITLKHVGKLFHLNNKWFYSLLEHHSLNP